MRARATCPVLLLAVLTLTRSAWAGDSERAMVDWPRALDDAWKLALDESKPHEVGTSRLRRVEQPSWVAVVPRVSFIARDWQSTRTLSGDALTLTDQFRVTRSSRMVFSRLRLEGGRFTPFAQFGAGEWRVDHQILATYADDQELAGQIGAGIETHLARSAALAFETDYTMLIREGGQGPVALNLPNPRFLGALCVARFSF